MDQQTQNNLLNISQRNYEEIADQYSETRKKHLAPVWGELVKYAEMVEDKESVLDIGCGNGRLLDVFKEKDVKYLGVDQSNGLIKNARELHPESKFELGNILELGRISEINFDYVFCIAVLHHLPGKKLQVDALKQLKNKVTAEGEILITVWNMWSQSRFRKLVFKYFLLKMIKKNNMDFGDILFDWKDSSGEKTSRRYYHAFTKRELKKICKKAGLKIKKLYKDSHNYYLILAK